MGTVIVNTTLIVGLGFFLGGINRVEQHFNQTSTTSLLNQLALSVASLLIPAAFESWADGWQILKIDRITVVSRATSILGYLLFIVYSFRSHSALFTEPHKKVVKRSRQQKPRDGAQHSISMASSSNLAITKSTSSDHAGHFGHVSGKLLIAVMVIDLILLGFCTNFLTDGIQDLDSHGVISQEFIGLILFPLLSCNFHAITLARRDKMSRSFEVSMHSSIQLLLCILPLEVMVGWGLGNEDMNLSFDPFQVICLFVVLLCLRASLQSGKSNW